MTIILTKTTELNLYDCVACGAPIVLTVPHERSLRNDHREFYCPTGHPQCFPQETEAERLRKALHTAELEKTRLAQQAHEAQNACDRNAIKAAVAEREAARMKKRAAAGVCPCCNRTFIQLQRHMKTKHPEHAA